MGLPAKFFIVLAALAGLAQFAQAEQYKSEVYDSPTQPAQTPQQTTNPYGKAVILQQQANQSISRKDYAGAITQLQQALSLNALSGPAAEEMQYTLAQLQMASGQYQKAVAALEPYIRSVEAKGQKVSADAYIALGASYAGLKQYAKALPMIQKAIATTKSPPQDWLQLQLAVQCSLGKSGDCAGAQAQMAQKNPNDKNGWLRLSGLHLRQGNMPRALAAMEMAWRQNLLTQPSELQNLAKLYVAAGNPYQAGTLLDRWMQEGKLDKSAANWELQGISWLRAREPEQALTALTQAAQLGNRGDLYLQIGQLQADRENWPAAASALTQALQKGGFKIGRGMVYLALGHVYFQQGEKEKAKQAFASAAKQGGSQAAAGQWLAYLDPQGTAQALDIALSGGAALSGPVAIEPVAIDVPIIQASFSPASSAAGPAVALADVDGLTPIGAQQAGNSDGSIPAWDGGITPERWPAGFSRGQKLRNPYPNDQPLFTITAANAAQYRGKLPAAHQQLLKRYPSYKMPVYPTRRSVSFPAAIYDATQRNAGKAKLLGSDSLQGAKLGFPFRKPQSGVEIMWNHRTRYRGDTVVAKSTQAVIEPSGMQSDRLDLTERVLFRYGNIKNPTDIMQDNILLYYLGVYSNRGNQSITVLAHETADSVKQPRNIWVVPPGLRRMFRIPPVGYDLPFPGSGGIFFVDMLDMYNGAFDRYVWKLVGRREFIIPYNAYAISDGSRKYSQLLTPKHFNQDATRYELHRVWVIEATERTGKKHSFGKRVFYVDEDSWTVVMVDNHDREGNPWRFQEGHLVARYDSQTPFCSPVITYDLKDGRYFASGLNGEASPAQFDVAMDKGDFTPAVVGARYIR